MTETRRFQWRRAWKQLHSASSRYASRWSRILVALVVGASLLVLLYGLITNWHELASYHWEIAYWPIPVALLLYGVAVALAATIWGSIVRRLGGRSHWAHDLRIYCTSSLAKRLPTPLWFVMGRVYLYEELGVSKAISSLATVVEGVLVLFSGLVTLLAFIPLSGSSALLGRYTWVIIALAAACLVLVLRPQSLRSVVNWLARRLGHGQAIVDDLDYQHMLLWTGMYSIVWILGGMILYLLVRIVHHLPIQYLPAVIGIWVSGGVVSHVAIVLPGGLGIKELTMAVMLSALVPMPIAIIISIVARLWFALNELLWLLLSSRVAGSPKPQA